MAEVLACLMGTYYVCGAVLDTGSHWKALKRYQTQGWKQAMETDGRILYLGSIPCITISSCLHSIMSFVNIAWKYGIEAAKTIRWALNLWSPICGQSKIQTDVEQRKCENPPYSFHASTVCPMEWYWRHPSMWWMRRSIETLKYFKLSILSYSRRMQIAHFQELL